MKIINIVQNTNIEDHKKILQSIILSAITEINNEGRMTPEVKNNLIENLDGFFAAASDNKRIDYLYKLSAEKCL